MFFSEMSRLNALYYSPLSYALKHQKFWTPLICLVIISHYGLCLWTSAILAVVFIIAMATCDSQKEAGSLHLAFGISMLGVMGLAAVGFLLAVYLIPVSFSLKLVLMGIETSGVMNFVERFDGKPGGRRLNTL